MISWIKTNDYSLIQLQQGKQGLAVKVLVTSFVVFHDM
jgi:hypothetical protein